MYTFTRAVPEDAQSISDLVHTVADAMENKRLFYTASMSPSMCLSAFERGGIGILARDGEGRLAGILLTDVPGDDEENLGLDAGLEDKELEKVMHVEYAAVLKEHTGRHLQQNMMARLEEELKGSHVRYLMCTISPDNPGSLKSALNNGYRVVKTMEKYGGLLRHVLMKQLW